MFSTQFHPRFPVSPQKGLVDGTDRISLYIVLLWTQDPGLINSFNP